MLDLFEFEAVPDDGGGGGAYGGGSSGGIYCALAVGKQKMLKIRAIRNFFIDPPFGNKERMA